ncbi:MAG TPA: hypothetical protein PK970_12405 [Hyphomicrobiaceae bacterium]|nr:hypothetical protein [Hyphomicrobiaceae bacterium]
MSTEDDDGYAGEGTTMTVFHATVYVVWDETGTVASSVDLDGAIEMLEENSGGKLRRAVAINLELPTSEPMEIDLDATAVAARSMPNVIPFKKK